MIGSRDEAVAAQDAGCDFIIAQGIEAGGHVRGHIGFLPLLSEIWSRCKCRYWQREALAADGHWRPCWRAARKVFGWVRASWRRRRLRHTLITSKL